MGYLVWLSRTNEVTVGRKASAQIQETILAVRMLARLGIDCFDENANSNSVRLWPVGGIRIGCSEPN